MPFNTPAGGVRLRYPRRFVVVALVVWVVMALVVPAAGAGIQRGSASTRRTGVPQINWAACGPQMECANVPVPLDWAHPNGPAIVLVVARHLASRPGQRIGSLFVNSGGPGDSGVAMVADRGAALDALTQGRFDIVSWDLRGGSGASAPVRCFASAGERASFWQGLPVPTTRAEERRYLAKTIALAQRCGALNGELLAHISTADTARDLDYLRQLVGDRQLTYFGESFGTLIGQTYANLFPHRVRALALDGLIDPVASAAGVEAVLASGLADTDRVFGQFLRLCEVAGPDRCALAGQGPVAPRVNRLLAQLRHAPIPAPSADPPGELTYGETLTALKLAALAEPSVWPQAAAALEAAIEGDGSVVATIARTFTSDQVRMAVQEQGGALVCADSPARHPASAWPRVVDRLEATSHIGGPVVGWLVGAPCASWPTPSADRYTGPWNATTAHPILVIGTRFDPNTPLRNAQLAARRLGNAVLLIHDGYGHTSHRDPSTCVMQATSRYLVNLTSPPPGTVCPSDRLPFDPDFGQPVP
jgi:pimeloyl-ACP methyl ester carboxylesterase